MKYAYIGQDKLIQSLLDKMHAIFDRAAGPNNRAEYMRQHNVSGIDWHFSLSADDIIKQKIPRAVAGCTGKAKVFSKLATETGLKHVVLTTARIADLNVAEQDRKDGKKEHVISGHQIIAVYDEKGNLRAFDPGRKELGYIKSEIKVGNIINFHFGEEVVPHRITAILTPQKFTEVNTYKKLRDLYVYGEGLDNRFAFLKSRASRNFDRYMKAFLDGTDIYMLPKSRLTDTEWKELNSMLSSSGVKLVPILHKDNYMYMKFAKADKKKDFENATAKIKVQQFNYIRTNYPNISDEVIKTIVDKQDELSVFDIYHMLRHTNRPYKLNKDEFIKAVEYGSRDTDGIKVFEYQDWTWARRSVVRHKKTAKYHISLNVSVVPGLIHALDEIIKQDRGELIDYYKFPKQDQYNEAIKRHDPVTIYLYSRNSSIEQKIVRAVAPYARSNEGLLGELLGNGVDINKETTDDYGMSVGQLASRQIYNELRKMRQNAI